MQDVMNLLDEITSTPECKEYQLDEFKGEILPYEDDYLEVAVSEINDQFIRETLEQEIMQHKELSRKAPSRMRHYNEVKTKKRAKQSAEILHKKELEVLDNLRSTEYESFRAYSRSQAAYKKVARVKTA